ncbi:YdiU family protein [Metasolibacillus meyeri]|uniref:Protein nucleotidyltransferase YdiU n=1 Tax=Metasolibacillus meyeri TaxID=1071052 RepID=A0AAW9NT21_9BACL|nr:YdiU family protein [Metasolibacillus meyeri]MEC1177595.1 YdiU family protein [Metasolibacillus meyeri]
MNIDWRFDNSYARLPHTFFVEMTLNPVQEPKLVILNKELAKELSLNSEALQTTEGIQELAGNKEPLGSRPLAQAYAGHQFGHFNMLGDGRAILLGEHLAADNKRVDIQLKGAGRTPFSRGGDGRAALGPMLREYIISEAMHALGIPTTRSLAVVTTGEMIMREEPLQGAILTRVASSHLRVGTFQYARRWGTGAELKDLADYAIQRHFPTLQNENMRYLKLLEGVIETQAQLIAKWQLVGFIHGVMNTDNMAISGETIDYGPCAFMDQYDPQTVFSSIDRQGRYAYQNQPNMALWNLARLAESLLPLIHQDSEQAIQIAEQALQQFSKLYEVNWLAGMRLKLGLMTEESQDIALIDELLQWMQTNEADYTNTFRAFTLGEFENSALYEQETFKQWHKKWQERLQQQPQPLELVQQTMRQHNPAIIPRNHRVEEALHAAAQGNLQPFQQLLKVLTQPFSYTTEQEMYAILPPASSCQYRTFCGT